jgi:hypothetical protein
MAEKHIYWDDSKQMYVEREPIASSSGSSDSGKHILTDANGKVDETFMPSGIAADIVPSVTSSESLSAGDLVNLHDNSGTLNVRLADASNGRCAHGFVKAAISSSEAVNVYLPSAPNEEVDSLTIAATYYLSTGGGVTDTAPTTSGHIVQEVGYATASGELFFDPQEPIERA